MEYMQTTGVPDLHATDGNRGVFVLRRIDGDQAVYYPEDRDYLLALDPKVTHHEVLAAGLI